MTDLDELLAVNHRPRKGPDCSVKTTAEAEPDGGTVLRQIIARPADEMPATYLSRELRNRDRPIHLPASAIQRHRRGDCRCGMDES